MITELEHAALSVSNLERSIDFYCQILGMSHARTIVSTPDMGLGAIIGHPGAAARIAHLTSGALMLELFEYAEPVGQPIPESRNQADVGYNHVAFASTDVPSDADVLRKHNIEFLGEPVEYRPGVWVLYFYGPDREVIELRQT